MIFGERKVLLIGLTSGGCPGGYLVISLRFPDIITLIERAIERSASLANYIIEEISSRGDKAFLFCETHSDWNSSGNLFTLVPLIIFIIIISWNFGRGRPPVHAL